MDASKTPDYAALQKPLEHFRANTKRLKIHPLELAALWIVCAHLVWLPWALGGMRLWGQIPSLVLAVLGMLVALLPRNYTEEHTGSNRFRLITWPKLVRFPLFWLGLALLGYITIQALNPAWEYRTDGKGWWMRKIAYTEWLPSGVRVPFDRWGPWRMLMIYASVWLTLCTIWIAFTRRRTVQLLFIGIAVNGVTLAVFGLAQRMLSNDKMFWFWNAPSGSTFFSSFVYKNHAGAYLDLTLAVICGLAGWYYLRSLRRLEKSNPAGVIAFFGTCTAVAILVSYARGATLVMLVFLALAIAAFVIHQLVVPNPNRRPVVAIALLLLFGYFLKTGMEALQSHLAWNRLEQGIVQRDRELVGCRIATKASIEMLSVHWKMGAGAGSFRFLFPAYQRNHPEIFIIDGSRAYWEHAHNDIIEIPLELGQPGTSLIVVAIGYLVFLLIRNYFWQNPVSVCLVLELILLVAYSWWDFPLQCPAILILWWVLAVGAAVWTQLEELNLKG